jgi:peptide/nickel transport system substrate-binding protein
MYEGPDLSFDGTSKGIINGSTLARTPIGSGGTSNVSIVSSVFQEAGPGGNSEMSIFGSQFKWATNLNFDGDDTVNLSGLKPGNVGYWNLHANQTSTNVSYNFTLVNTPVVAWSLGFDYDTVAKVSDSTIERMGYSFISRSVQLDGVRPGFYENWTLNNLTLTNVDVSGHWGLGSLGQSSGVVTDTNAYLSFFNGNSNFSIADSYILLCADHFNSGELAFSQSTFTMSHLGIHNSDFYIHGNVHVEPPTWGWSWVSSKITRNYEIVTVDLNGSTLENVELRLSDRNNVTIWSGHSDSFGKANFNVTFVDGNYSDALSLTAVKEDLIAIRSLQFLSSTPVILALRTTQAVPSDQLIVGKSGTGNFGTLPSSFDPACINEIGEIELDMNVYEPLISFDREKIDSFTPRLAASWNISSDGLTYTFAVRQGVKFHDGRTLTAEDVEYSFERFLVVDGGWSSFLLYDALFGLPGSRDETNSLVITAQQIDNAVTRTGDLVSFHLTRPFAPFLQILAIYGFIMNKNWCVSHGEWPGTWSNWASYNRPLSTAISLQDTEPPGPHTNAMCGTGPYMLDYRQPGASYSLTKFDEYWRGWPAPGANGSLQRVTVEKIDDWPTRRDMFLAGELDSVDVPDRSASPTAIDEVLGQPGVRCIYPLPELECSSMFFEFNISSTSPFVGVAGGLPQGTFGENGAPLDIFQDAEVRRGFAYALDYSKVAEVFGGEACQPATPIIPGLTYYNSAQEKYSMNLTKARECFQNAWNGQLWANGFNFTFCAVSDRGGYLNIAREKAYESLKTNIETLNPKFHINIQNMTWESYTNARNDHEIPMFGLDWLADYADAHDFAWGFMKSDYWFAGVQSYRNSTIDALIDEGVSTTNSTRRKEIYEELQQLYWEDCPSFTLFQPWLRRFERDYVQGWYFNTFLSVLNYFYVQWKGSVPQYALDPGQNVVDAVNSTGTLVSINTTSSGSLTITSNDMNLEGTTDSDEHYLKCVTIDTTVPHQNITFPIDIRIYYTDQDVVSAYVDQTTLRIFSWNGTAWLLENDTGVVVPSDVPGYAGYVWAKIWHLSAFAAVGQKTLVHSIATKEVRLEKNIVGQGLCANVFTDVFNLGSFDESFNVTLYANSTALATFTNLTLVSGNSVTIAFIWNTTGFAYGNYTLTAYASIILNESDTEDNIYTGGWVIVSIIGDITGPSGLPDGKCDMRDIGLVARSFGQTVPPANPNCDITGPTQAVPDGKIDMRDISLVARHFGEHL